MSHKFVRGARVTIPEPRPEPRITFSEAVYCAALVGINDEGIKDRNEFLRLCGCAFDFVTRDNAVERTEP